MKKKPGKKKEKLSPEELRDKKLHKGGVKFMGSCTAPRSLRDTGQEATTRLHWQTLFHSWPTLLHWDTLWNPDVSYFLPKLILPNQLHH